MGLVPCTRAAVRRSREICAIFIKYDRRNYLFAPRFSDSAVSEEAAEHQFQIVHNSDDLSEAWFEIK